MSAYLDETAVKALGDGRYRAELTTAWDIGDTANGGYITAPVLHALSDLTGAPDPLSVTTHFLRPVRGGGTATIDATMVRRGRQVSVARGSLVQADAERLVVNAAFGDLTASSDIDLAIDTPPPVIPRPDECPDRTELGQGVELPIASRVDVRIAPSSVEPNVDGDAVMDTWMRFADGTPPSAMALPLFADAVPPSLFVKYGRVGWVPTIELTVHVRRRPVDGWIQARTYCDDLADGRMIETGTLWDADGNVVARCRQLGLLLQAS